MVWSGKVSNEAQWRAALDALIAHGSRRLIVQRGLVERSGERSALGVSNCRSIEPKQMQDGSGDGDDRPFAARAVAEREHGGRAEAVVCRHDVVSRFRQPRPPVEVAAAEGESSPCLGPPSRGPSDDAIKWQRLLGHARSAFRHVELDGELMIHHRQGEAARIEVHSRDRLHCAATELVLGVQLVTQRVDERRERATARRRDTRGSRVGEEIGKANRPARAEIENAASRCVPGFASWFRDVYVVVEG
jgi:hypothetical protein